MPPTKARSSVYETPRVGVEAIGATGVPVACNRQLSTLGWTITPAPNVDSYSPDGTKYDTGGTLISEQTNVKGDGRPDFRDIIYTASSALTDPVITTPAGATTARKWQWLLNSDAPDGQRTLSLEAGSDAIRAAYVAGVQITDFSITTNRQNAPALSVAGWGYAWSDDHVRWLKLTNATAGTFTITLQHSGGSAATTSAIAYNATASTIQAAIATLANVGTGNVRVTGGPASTQPVRIELIRERADVVLDAWTVDGTSLTGTSPTAALTRLTPGATPLNVRTVSPVKVDLFVSPTSFADLDTIMAVADNAGAEMDMFNFGWGITGRNTPYFPLNSNYGTGPAGSVESKPRTSISIDVMSGPRSGYFNGALRSQKPLYIRYRAKGDFIETVSGDDIYQMLTIDTCVHVTGISELKGIQNNVLGHTFTGAWQKDATTGRAAIMSLITDVAAF